MDRESTEFLEILKRFVKENLVIVVLFTLGLMFLSIGLIQLLSQKPSEVSFEKGSEKEETASIKKEIITVDIEGAILRPGVYSFEKEVRLQDVLIKAGGLSADADRAYLAKQINLAKKVSDGEKIYIPRQSDTTASSKVAGVSQVVDKAININTASVFELDSLPSIGKVTADKIVEGRPYGSIEELLSKKIVSKSVFEKIKEKIITY